MTESYRFVFAGTINGRPVGTFARSVCSPYLPSTLTTRFRKDNDMATLTSISPEQRAADNALIEQAYQNLLRKLPKLDGADRDLLQRAYELGREAHSKQRRKSGEPYFTHPIEVARICAEEIGLGPTAIVCALLHDVVEDTPVTLADIDAQFGDRVAKIVDGLTKLDGSYHTHDVESPQAENFKKVISTLVEDVRVVLIKMADRLHNMRTLGAMPRHKQLKIAAETSYIYAPLAHRLGLYAIKTEFQDLCMRIIEPEVYYELERKVRDSEERRQSYIEEFKVPLRKGLDAMEVPYRIFGRAKSIYSIHNKIKTKEVPFEEIYDLFAVRIVIDAPVETEKQKCWYAYSTVTDIYKPIPERLKDWITTPKSNGYESLHTTVIGPGGRYVEVQIRSERMDEIAERGFAAHWKYKGVISHSDVYDNWLNNVREILDSPNSDTLEFLSDFKTNLFNEEIYVYTPNGDMKILPKGATALDFAFSIHTDVGYHASAIKVNKKLVPMGYRLNNGDQVTVITSPNQSPKEAWSKMVVTGRARSKIRHAMKEERRRQGEIGKETLMRKLKALRVEWDPAVDTLVEDLGYQSRVDFYFDLSNEKLNLTQALKRYRVEGNKLVALPVEQAAVPEVPPKPSKNRRTKKKNNHGTKPRLLVGGEPADNYQLFFATCCNPVQGDAIFAYLTASAGLKIHRANCPNAPHLLSNYGYRVMKAEWVDNAKTTFVAELKVIGVDDGPGIIEQISHVLNHELHVNIRRFSIEGDEGYFEGTIGLLVLNTDQLNLAIKTLKELPSVSSVERIN